MQLEGLLDMPGPPKEPKRMAHYPKTESIGNIGSIILAILEVQVDHSQDLCSHRRCSPNLEAHAFNPSFRKCAVGSGPRHTDIPLTTRTIVFEGAYYKALYSNYR